MEKLAYRPAELAEATGTSVEFIRQQIKEKKLTARKISDVVVILREEVERWLQNSVPVFQKEEAVNEKDEQVEEIVHSGYQIILWRNGGRTDYFATIGKENSNYSTFFEPSDFASIEDARIAAIAEVEKRTARRKK